MTSKMTLEEIASRLSAGTQKKLALMVREMSARLRNGEDFRQAAVEVFQMRKYDIVTADWKGCMSYFGKELGSRRSRPWKFPKQRLNTVRLSKFVERQDSFFQNMYFKPCH